MSGLKSAQARVAAAIVLLVLLLAAISVVAVWSARDHKSRLESLEERSEAAAALESARSNFYMEAIGLLGGALVEDPLLQDAAARGRAGMRQDLAEARTALEAAGDTEAVLLLENLTARMKELQGTVDQLLPVVEAGGAMALITAFPLMVDTFEETVAELDAMAGEQRAAFVSEEDAASNAANAALWALVGLASGAFLLAVGAALRLTASVVGPLASLRATAGRITSGDLEARATVSGPEEVASLARDFNEMTDALSVKTQEYIATTNLTGDIIGKWDKQGRWVFLNDAACQFFGGPREELLGTDSIAGVHPEDVESTVQAVQEATATKELVKGFVNRCLTPMGTRVVEWNGYPLFDGEDQYVGVQVTGRDITERQQMEQALRESEERFRQVAETSREWIWEFDAQGHYTYSSPAVRGLLGYEAEEVIGKHFLHFVAPEESEGIVTRAKKTFARKKGFFRVTVKKMHKDGHTVVVESTGRPILDAKGNVLGYRGVDQDITERKRAEEALQESEEKYRRLVEDSIDGIAIIEGAEIRFVNRAILSMVGCESEEEIIGRPFSDFLSPEYRDTLLERNRAREQGQPVPEHYEFKALRKDGSEFDGEVSIRTITYQGKAAFQAIVRDITERKKAEEALRDSEEKYRRLIEHSIDGIAIAEGPEVRFVNRALLEMLGHESEEEIVGRPFTDWVSPQSQELMLETRQAREAGHPVPDRFEFKAVRKDGTEFDVEVSIGWITYQGKVASQAIVRDITERKKAEDALRQSEERYRLLAENASDVIWTTDINLRFTYVSPSVQHMRGYTAEEAMAQPMEEVLTPASLEVARQTLAEELAIEKLKHKDLSRSRTLELEQICKDGSTNWIEVIVTFLRDEDSRAIGIVGVSRDITERKRAEEALLAKAQEYVDTANLTADIMARADEDGRWVFLNDAACQFFGKPREELLSTDARDSLHPDDLEATVRAVEEAGATRNAIRGFVNRQLTPMGTKVVEWNAYPLFHQDGQYAGIQMTGRDVTERKEAEEALASSEERLRILFEFAPDAYYLNDFQGTFVDGNRAAEELIGYKKEELVGNSFLDIQLLDPKQLPRAAANLSKNMQGLPTGPDEFTLIRKDGSQIPVEIRTFPVQIDGQTLALGIARDITERKRAEEAVRESERRYRLLAENASDVIWTMDLSLRYTYISPSITRMRGYSVEEVMVQTVNESMTPASREVAVKTLAEELALERVEHKDVFRTRTLELEMNCKDGSTIWSEMKMTFLRDQDGQPVGILGVTRDISERKRAEEALRDSEHRLRSLVTNAPVILFAIDRDGVFTLSEGKGLAGLGLRPGEVVSRSVAEVYRDAPQIIEQMRRALAGEEFTTTVEVGGLWFETHYTPVRGQNGEIAGGIGVAFDVTERKKAEEEREKLHGELEARAITDSLTGLYDHAQFYRRLAEEMERSKRYDHGFAVVMMDVDDFKRFNESHGHQVGDEILRLVARCIPAGLRRSDLAFRYGGDEFAAILPHADSSKARAVVERINRRITKALKEMDSDGAAGLTLSAGVACFPQDGTTVDDLVRVADAALYSTKWIARARDIRGQREDIGSLVSALVSRRSGDEDTGGQAAYRPEALHEQQARIMSSVASSIAVALIDAGVSQALEDPDLQIVALVGAAAALKDRYIRGHPERTSAGAVALAEEMGLSPERIKDIRIAGLLHDIGKVTVSEGILNNPGKLSRRQFARIKDHPNVGATLLSQVKGFERLVPIVRHHHERFDGKGYPDGLAGEGIPLEARILSVVDVFDAMTHERSYRTALSREETIAELERGAGSQLDPAVVEAFLALVKSHGEELPGFARAPGEGKRLAATTASAGNDGGRLTGTAERSANNPRARGKRR